jgi:Tripartite tricarboxylate transporter family receptor
MAGLEVKAHPHMLRHACGFILANPRADRLSDLRPNRWGTLDRSRPLHLNLRSKFDSGQALYPLARHYAFTSSNMFEPQEKVPPLFRPQAIAARPCWSPNMVSGQVQVMFVSMAPAIELIRAGRLRATAVTTVTRAPALPDVPTVDETAPGYEAVSWAGVGAPGRHR